MSHKTYDAFGYVIASKRITVDEARIGFMYRDETADESDSGWRFFAGDEDEVYAANADNFTVNAITTILDIDSSIEKYLEAGYRSAFERTGPEWDFTPVPEYFAQD